MPKASPEVALEEFERMADAADVNVDVSNLDEEGAEEVEETRTLFTSAIENGDISVDEEGRAVLHAKQGDVVFRVPEGKDLMILASARDDKRVEALNRFVSSITGKDSRSVGKLTKREWKLAMKLAGFLAAD